MRIKGLTLPENDQRDADEQHVLGNIVVGEFMRRNHPDLFYEITVLVTAEMDEMNDDH